MNLKNKGKTNKRTKTKAGNSNNQANTGNQQTPEILQNSGNPNILIGTGTIGVNNRVVAAAQLETNTGSFANQNIQNNFSKFYL